MSSKFSINDLRAFHRSSGFRTAGKDDKDIFNLSDDMLFYLRSLLSEDVYEVPDSSSEEWEHFLSCLDEHKIAPLVYSKTKFLPSSLCPPSFVLKVLAKKYLAAMLYYKEFSEQLHLILNALENINVIPLVLKGGALRWMVYPDPVTRVSGDIDLLLKEEDVLKAREVLESMGYTDPENRFLKYKTIICEDEFYPGETKNFGFLVELHWSLYKYNSFFAVSVEELFENAVVVQAKDFSFYSLDLVGTMIHCSTHLTLSHNKQISVFWIYDIMLLANRLESPEYWRILQDECKHWNNILAVENALKLAQIWTGLSLPQGFEDFSKWPVPSQNELEIWNYSLQRHSNIIAKIKLHWKIPASRWLKIKLMFRDFFPSPRRIQKIGAGSKERWLPLSYLKLWRKYVLKLMRDLLKNSYS